MTSIERAETLRGLCMDVMQERARAIVRGTVKEAFRDARWEIGVSLRADVAAMKELGGRYAYTPGLDGAPGRLFGLPVAWVEELDGLSIVTGDAL